MIRQLPLLLILLVGILYWLEGHLNDALYTTSQELARRSGLMAVSAVQTSMASEESHRTWNLVGQKLAPYEDTQIEIVNMEGKVLYGTEPESQDRTYQLTDPSCVPCHVGGSLQAATQSTFIQESDDIAYNAFAAPLSNTEECRQCHEDDGPKLGMVYVRQSFVPVRELIRTTQIGLIIAGTIALILTVLTTRILLGRYLGRPLKRLVASARAIGSGNLESKIHLPEHTELSVLASTLNNSAQRLLDTIQQVERQRDDLQTMYYIAGNLSRTVQPHERRQRAVELASIIFDSDCLLIAGTFQPEIHTFVGTLTVKTTGSGIIEHSFSEADLRETVSFYSPELVERWFQGGLDGETRVREGSTVAYPLERRSRRLGLILAPARAENETDDGRATAANPEVVQALCKHLAIALEFSELQRESFRREKLAAIGETVAGLAHCLKNTLNGLRGGQYVIERAMENDNPEKLRQGWRILTNSVRHIERLSLDMIYYAGEHKLKLEPTNPNLILQEVVDLLNEAAHNQGVELREEFDEMAGEVPLDRHAIYRAILNLVSNAVDACVESETGDSVILRSRSGPEDVVLTVEDNGIGMSESTLKRMFERFFTTKSSKGTGLGLPVVKKIAEEHGGSLEVESELGRGTVFHLRLPKIVNEPDKSP
jgi:signal transduction histidine kinase/HAMP domain-containing protein